MLIAPVLQDGPAYGDQRPRCEVCRIGAARYGCFHAHGGFLICLLCAGIISAGLVVRVAFKQDTSPALDPVPLA